jgi:hypothetical protein
MAEGKGPLGRDSKTYLAGFGTSDPEKLGNIALSEIPGAKLSKDQYGNPVLVTPDNKQHYLDRYGANPATIKALGGRMLTDLPFMAIPGAGPVALGAKMALGQIPISAATRALGSKETIGQSTADVGGAFVGGAVVPGAASLGTRLFKGIGGLTSRLGATVDENFVGTFMRQHNLPWSELSDTTRANVMKTVGGKSPAAAAEILGDPRNAQQLVTRSSTPQEIGGLLDRRSMTPEQAGEGLLSGLRSVPERTRQAESLAWQDFGNQHGMTAIPKSSSENIANSVQAVLGDTGPNDITAPNANQILHKVADLAESFKDRPTMPTAAVLDLRNEITTKIADVRAAQAATPRRKGFIGSGANDIQQLQRIRDGLDNYISAGSPELRDAVQPAIDATRQAARYDPAAKLPDNHPASVIDSLIRGVDTMPPEKAFKLIRTADDPAAVIKELRQHLPDDHPVFAKLEGGYLGDIMTGGKAGNVASLKPSDMAARLGQLLDDKGAQSLFSTREMSEVSRLHRIAQEHARTGDNGEAMQGVLARSWLISGAKKIALGVGLAKSGLSPLGGAMRTAGGVSDLAQGALSAVTRSGAGQMPAIPFPPATGIRALPPMVRGGAAMAGAAGADETNALPDIWNMAVKNRNMGLLGG